ncbi:MAG: hypothetical protein ABIT04_06975 [Novosphingobium sp.]
MATPGRTSGPYPLLAAAALAFSPAAAGAQPEPFRSAPPSMTAGPTYADLADLAESAPLVIRAKVRRLVRVEDARSPGLRPGRGRFYVEALTRALLTGAAPLGERLAFLADLPLDARGRPPAITKQDVLLFARRVPGRPGELALVAPDALLLWDAATEARLRPILTALLAPDVPARITGVRELIQVPGNLVGEGATQIFLSTADGTAASLTVERRQDRPPRWGASFSELTAEIGNPPARETLAWYRLACFLPRSAPPSANLSDSAQARAQAEADYRMILSDLGNCQRNRR